MAFLFYVKWIFFFFFFCKMDFYINIKELCFPLAHREIVFKMCFNTYKKKNDTNI